MTSPYPIDENYGTNNSKLLFDFSFFSIGRMSSEKELREWLSQDEAILNAYDSFMVKLQKRYEFHSVSFDSFLEQSHLHSPAQRRHSTF